MPDLSKKYPAHWQDSPETLAIWSALSSEIANLQDNYSDLIAQCNVNDATWGLALWEQRVGLATDATKSDEYRRTRILAKLRGTGTVTVAMIQNVALSFECGEVDVVEVPSEYRFEIHFVSTFGTPPNMDDLIATIDEIKPAHLVYSLVYIFRNWENLEEYIWSDLEDNTWDEVLEGTL